MSPPWVPEGVRQGKSLAAPTYRKRRPHIKVSNRYRMEGGEIAVDSIKLIGGRIWRPLVAAWSIARLCLRTWTSRPVLCMGISETVTCLCGADQMGGP